MSGNPYAEWYDERGYPRGQLNRIPLSSGSTDTPSPAITQEVNGRIVSVDMPVPDPVYVNARLRGETSRVRLCPFPHVPFVDLYVM